MAQYRLKYCDKVSGYTSMFSAIFTKGNNFHDFLLCPWTTNPSLKWVCSSRKEFALGIHPHWKGRQNEKGRFASLESIFSSWSTIEVNVGLFLSPHISVFISHSQCLCFDGFWLTHKVLKNWMTIFISEYFNKC